MPQSEERKREYNKLRNRRLRGYGNRRLGFAKVSPQRGDREYEGKGVVPNVVPSDIKRGNVVPPYREGNVVPIPMNPRTMSKRKLVDYLAHVGRLGFSLVETGKGYELVANTGSLVPFDGVAVLEATLQVHGRRIMTLEADLARLEAMMVSLLREGELRDAVQPM